jgi:hypothetical protein
MQKDVEYLLVSSTKHYRVLKEVFISVRIHKLFNSVAFSSFKKTSHYVS